MSKKFWIFFVVLIVLAIISYTASLFVGGGHTDKMFNITEDGFISIKPEYVDISQFNEERYSKEVCNNISTYANTVGLYSEDIVVMHYLTNNNIKETYASVEDVQEVIKKLEFEYNDGISHICEQTLSENRYIEFLIRCKLSTYKATKPVNSLKIPAKIGKINVTGISEYGLAGISWAKNLYIPDSVNTIENSAFFMSSIENIYISSDRVDYGQYAFEGMSKLNGVFDKSGKDITSNVVTVTK